MQDLLVNWFGSAGATVIKYALAFAVIAGLLWLLRWVLQNSVGGGALAAFKGRQNRLAVVDAVAVDPKRRLILVRRDNVEHLILVGGGNDLVVEPTIIRGVPVGSIGRAGLRSSAPVAAEPEDTARSEPSAIPVEPAPAIQSATPEPLAQPAPVPVRAAEAPIVRQPPLSRSNPVERSPAVATLRPKPVPQRAPVVEPTPVAPTAYVPPEPERVVPTVSPIAAIVPQPESPIAAPEQPVAQPAPESNAFEDLARHLDEALKNDLGDIGAPVEAAPAPAPVRPATAEVAPLARPAPTTPEPKVEPRAQPAAARPVIPAASAWLRPRTQQQTAKPAEPKSVEAKPVETPAVEARIEPRVADPKPVEAKPVERSFAPRANPTAVERRPRVASPAQEPVAEPTALTSPSFDEDLTKALESSLVSRESSRFDPPHAAPVVAAVPAVEPPPVAAPAKADAPEFSSLEDEMARLLDELAGDSKGKR
ncbi:flagellar biosynthetic protein FliO [Oryzibacter oryziterrae]|uniref:flagellar biosynthetic protein FliO n=1 Tax=Oryzibacter oryziterrae TaxID=2766474 RepID=UPI001F0026EF|nr:flagellar biosynthetic protein FliO [Oryzibacter oryziterrae]